MKKKLGKSEKWIELKSWKIIIERKAFSFSVKSFTGEKLPIKHFEVKVWHRIFE